MMAAKFKVGDKVHATADAPKGEIGVIVKDDGIEPRYLVKFDKWADGHGNDGREWWLYSKELDLAALTIQAGRYYKTPAIVALIENGHPLPATRPYVHPNRAAAETEAKRLAGKHPGGEFGVYEFVSSAKEAKTYAHEWQRLAANGDKDGAIDRLISDAGISRMDAHSAVRRFAA